MGLWLVLFACFFLAVMVPAALVLRTMSRAEKDKLKSALAQVDPDRPIVTASVVLETAPETQSRTDRLLQLAGWRAAAGEGVLKRPGAVVTAIVAGAAAGLLAGIPLSATFGVIAIPAVAVAGMALPILYLRRVASKRLAAFEEQLPDALDFLARSVRTGNALSVSLEMLVPETSEPLRGELVRVTREQALGASLDAALRGLTQRVPLLELRFFVAAVLLHRETGGNLSEILTKLSRSVRERLRIRAHVKAASAQGRLTARVLSVLPVLVVLGMNAISPSYFAVMTGQQGGRMMLMAAAISQVIGYCCMKRIVDIEV